MQPGVLVLRLIGSGKIHSHSSLASGGPVLPFWGGRFGVEWFQNCVCSHASRFLSADCCYRRGFDCDQFAHRTCRRLLDMVLGASGCRPYFAGVKPFFPVDHFDITSAICVANPEQGVAPNVCSFARVLLGSRSVSNHLT